VTADYYDSEATDRLWAFMEPPRATTAPSPVDDDADRWVGPPEDEARRLRDRGVETALNAADSRARGAAERALRELAESGRTFTSDDLRERVGAPLACRQNVLGALFLTAAQSGLIERVGYRQSTRREARGRELKLWRGTGRVPDEPASSSPTPAPAAKPAPAAGVWTAADEPAPCSVCRKPAFMRDPSGRPRHRAACGGGA